MNLLALLLAPVFPSAAQLPVMTNVVSLSWNASTDPYVTGYYVCDGPNLMNEQFDVGNVTNYVLCTTNNLPIKIGLITHDGQGNEPGMLLIPYYNGQYTVYYGEIDNLDSNSVDCATSLFGPWVPTNFSTLRLTNQPDQFFRGNLTFSKQPAYTVVLTNPP